MSDKWRVDPDLSLAAVEAELPETNRRVQKLLTKLYSKRFGRFSNEEVYLCISTHTGLPWTLPLAVERLQADPMLEAVAHPGDLLTAVLGVDGAFWKQQPELAVQMADVAQRALQIAQEMGAPLPLDEILGDDLLLAIQQFITGVKPEEA